MLAQDLRTGRTDHVHVDRLVFAQLAREHQAGGGIHRRAAEHAFHRQHVEQRLAPRGSARHGRGAPPAAGQATAGCGEVDRSAT